jgi:hypothetical protein
VPPAPIRQLRDLTRARTAMTRERGREIQRLEKLLEDAGIKLSSVASDITCVSGRLMLQALIDGQHDPVVLADLAKRWVCQSDLAPLGGLVLARCGPTLDHRFPSTFGSSAKAIRRGEGLEGEIESGAV